MDRTNWEFGHREINFLVISIVTGKVSIPIAWKVLPKKTRGGNSNTRQRIALSRKLLKILPAKEIRVLTMDREFTGKQWLTWLEENEVCYVVRIKKNARVGAHQAISYAKSRGRKSSQRQQVFGLDLFFSSKVMKKDGRDSHLLLVSNRFQGKEALQLYRMRWGIERLFGHLKKNGFDLESTHMIDAKKLEQLFAVVVLAFVLSFAWGCHLRASQQRVSAQSNRKSLFRLGLEDILRLMGPGPQNPIRREELRCLERWICAAQFDSIFLV